MFLKLVDPQPGDAGKSLISSASTWSITDHLDYHSCSGLYRFRITTSRIRYVCLDDLTAFWLNSIISTMILSAVPSSTFAWMISWQFDSTLECLKDYRFDPTSYKNQPLRGMLFAWFSVWFPFCFWCATIQIGLQALDGKHCFFLSKRLVNHWPL